MALLDNNKTSILENKVKKDIQEKKEVEKQVYKENIKVTDDEKSTMLEITKVISGMFKEKIAKMGINNPELNKEIVAAIREQASNLDKDFESQKRIEKATISNIIGLGPIEAFRTDKSITEIIVERYDKICVEKNGKIYTVDASFIDEQHLQNIINRIVQPVGKEINLANPIVDARLMDGSRVNATIPPVSPDGATLTIRKFSADMMTAEDYISTKSIHKKMLYFLSKCVEGRITIMVSGGTGSGKTTMLNLLSSFMSPDELIITIENPCELQLKQPHVRRLEVRTSNLDGKLEISSKVLVKNCLRMRPDRIIVGESRDESVVDMITAMSTGHEGSMSTIHANSPEDLIYNRFPILFDQANGNHTEKSINRQISSAIDVIVQVKRLKSGKRATSHITALDGLDENGNIKLVDIFVYNEEKDRFEATGNIPESIIQKLNNNHINLNMDLLKGGVLND